MARTEGEIVIGRPVDVVLDYVADRSSEPLRPGRRTQHTEPGFRGREKHRAIGAAGASHEVI